MAELLGQIGSRLPAEQRQWKNSTALALHICFAAGSLGKERIQLGRIAWAQPPHFKGWKKGRGDPPETH